MHLRGLIFVLCLFCVFGVGVHAGAQTPAQPASAQPSYASDPRFAAAMADAAHLMKQHQFGFAIDSYKKANKIAGGQCFDCLKGVFSAQTSEHEFKAAMNTASAMEGIATTPQEKSMAEFRRASALYMGAGDKPKTDKLEATHGLLQEAIGANPKNAPALFLDGKVLAQMGKLDAAKTEFAQCVSCVSANDPAKLRAAHFAENPELALHKMAPPFEVVAMDGSKFNLDAMGGRAVLIDFWATWCGPCNREIPHMKKIAQQFAGQPLVMISVSLDKDETKWKDFVAKHGMSWAQYRDGDGTLAQDFDVTTIPRYFTIDSDGVLTSVMVDEGSDVEGKLKTIVAKAREAQKPTAAGTAGAGQTPGN